MVSRVFEFIQSGGFLVLENQVMAGGAIPAALPALENHCLFRTSGSSGTPRFVALSREALLHSAESVNRRFSISRSDRWLRSIPEFHVGGFGIHARAFAAGCAVDVLEGRWAACRFLEEAEQLRTTLVSLVPTQVFDLVEAGMAPPSSLRVAIVGGGALGKDLGERGLDLGWPLVETFGMTETGSMMAVRECGGGSFTPLEGWEIREMGEVLEVRGESLFFGYVREIDGIYTLEDPKTSDGWFRTSDRVRIREGGFEFLGRETSEVKVLGELVDLDRIQDRVGRVAKAMGSDGRDLIVVAVPDARRGCELVLADGTGGRAGEKVRSEVNRELAGFERLGRWVEVGEIPRSALGKVMRGELEEKIRQLG